MATKLKSVETETTPPRRFPVAARRAFSKRDSALLTAVLRQDFRWRDCGLDAPPREALLDEELFVSDPKKHKAKPGYTLIFDNAVVPSHLMAVLVDYGKTRSSDKNRVAELILLDRRSRARALSDKILKAGLSVVFRQGKAKSIMARVNGGPYSLAKLVGNSPGIEQIIEEELPWVFFKPDDLPVSLRPDDRVILPDTAQISADDMSDLLAFGTGGWGPGFERKTIPLKITPNVRIHSGSKIEAIRGFAAWRKFFFKDDAETVETDVLIVGGGLGGLSAAFASTPAKTILLEASASLGGMATPLEGPFGSYPVMAKFLSEPSMLQPELERLCNDLDIFKEENGRKIFADPQSYVREQNTFQLILPDGRIHTTPWELITENPSAEHLFKSLEEADEADHKLSAISFSKWLQNEHIGLDAEVEGFLDLTLRRAYGAKSDEIAAKVAITYINKALDVEKNKLSIFAPRTGFGWVAKKLIQKLKDFDWRPLHTVREIKAFDDHVEVMAFDTQAKKSVNFKAKTVIFAAGKSGIKTIFPKDAKLFKDHRYSSWATVTLALRELPERQLLGWRNAVQRPGQSFIDFVWINHSNPDEPPVLTHHILFGTGSRARAELRATTPQQLVKASIHYLGLFAGRDITPNVEHAQVHKIDRALVVPSPTLRREGLNDGRAHKRVIYAGADVLSLPTMESALLSGIKAAELSKEIID